MLARRGRQVDYGEFPGGASKRLWAHPNVIWMGDQSVWLRARPRRCASAASVVTDNM